MKKITIKETANLLSFDTAEIIPPNGLEEKLQLADKENRPLKVKLGFDPTAPDLHLGHAVVLKKLREFQELGHTVIVVIGDFTACIGDPTGKNKTRPALTQEDVKTNTETYINQLSKILDMNRVVVKFNSEWFDKMDARDVVELLAKYTLAQMLQRDDFRNRYSEGIPVALHELMYPLLQGEDSRQIKADIEIGGTDQTFNCMVGRHLQKVSNQVAQIVLTMPLLRGLDGTQKMSKSANNYVGLNDKPNDMYGKIMSIPDNVLDEYINLTVVNNDKESLLRRMENNENPMEVKKDVASNIVEQYHSQIDAEAAEEDFRKRFQERNKIEYIKKELPENINLADLTVINLCKSLGLNRSNSEIRRLISQGGISINEEKVNDDNYDFSAFTNSFKLKVGKKIYYEVQT